MVSSIYQLLEKLLKETLDEMMNEARAIATKRMVAEAEALGADAIVNIRYASAAVMQGAAEVIGNVILSITKSTGSTKSIHDGTCRTMDTTLNFLSINRAFSFF